MISGRIRGHVPELGIDFLEEIEGVEAEVHGTAGGIQQADLPRVFERAERDINRLFQQLFLRREHNRRGFDDMAVDRHGGNLDDRTAEVTGEQLEAAGFTERRIGITHNFLVHGFLRQITPDQTLAHQFRHFAILLQTLFGNRSNIAMHIPTFNQLTDDEGGAAYRLELVHVGSAIRVDT